MDHVIKRRRSLRDRLRVVHILGSQSERACVERPFELGFLASWLPFLPFFYQNNTQKYLSEVIYLASVIKKKQVYSHNMCL